MSYLEVTTKSVEVLQDHGFAHEQELDESGRWCVTQRLLVSSQKLIAPVGCGSGGGGVLTG